MWRYFILLFRFICGVEMNLYTSFYCFVLLIGDTVFASSLLGSHEIWSSIELTKRYNYHEFSPLHKSKTKMTTIQSPNHHRYLLSIAKESNQGPLRPGRGYCQLHRTPVPYVFCIDGVEELTYGSLLGYTQFSMVLSWTTNLHFCSLLSKKWLVCHPLDVIELFGS